MRCRWMEFGVMLALAAAAPALSTPVPGETAAMVAVDETGAVRINGEAFFPIGLYQVPYWDMADVKAHGFNIVDEIQPVASYLDRTFLDTARQNELWVRVALYSGFTWWNGTWEPTMREQLDYAFLKDYPGDHISPKHHPALAMWYLEDEPNHSLPPVQPYHDNMVAAHEYIHSASVDPNHVDMACLYDPDFQNADSLSRMSFFGNWCFPDVVAVDCYPLNNPPGPNPFDAPLTALAKWLDDLCKAASLEGAHPSVQMVLETFQFSSWRMPTPEQLRLMVYLSIIHGAKGIWYFCYGESNHAGQHFGPGPGLHDFPSIWAYVGRLNRELADLGDVFLSPAVLQGAAPVTTGPALPDRYGYLPIHYTLRQHDGFCYLISANGSEKQPCTATFPIPSAQGGQAVEVLFENRTLLAAGGVLTDQYSPMAVHVYRWPAAS